MAQRMWYLPVSQPRNWYEEAYCVPMRETIASHISELQKTRPMLCNTAFIQFNFYYYIISFSLIHLAEVRYYN